MPCRRTPAPWQGALGTPHARVTRLLHCNLGTKGSSLTSAGRQELRDKHKVRSSSAIGIINHFCVLKFDLAKVFSFFAFILSFDVFLKFQCSYF